MGEAQQETHYRGERVTFDKVIIGHDLFFSLVRLSNYSGGWYNFSRVTHTLTDNSTLN